ncbi:hypothetical protein LQ953_05185 [Sphingomonas sp. IC-56]|uniref:hypothetical protein n=1 Tax=Sphingomonas sp. IC-56 TaxID=2898529 RepID=UPI001E5BAB49|nr:hypothetical protein [Sphingomonas sp. IC-56]MCD2323407.1 hypothetical protein [Sphingomonas sp. IC-56]
MHPDNDGKKPLFEQLRGLLLLFGFGLCTLTFLVAIDRAEWSKQPSTVAAAAMPGEPGAPADNSRAS